MGRLITRTSPEMTDHYHANITRLQAYITQQCANLMREVMQYTHLPVHAEILREGSSA